MNAESPMVESEPQSPSKKLGDRVYAAVRLQIAEGRFPVILARTPYNKASGGKDRVELVRYFASRGYVFVAMDVRGRGDSDGEWLPYRHDGADGYDAIEWCAVQPWSNGKVGTIGGSYNGKIQWLTAILRPPHLAAMIATTSPSDPFVEFPTGVPPAMSFRMRRPWTGRRSTTTCRS